VKGHLVAHGSIEELGLKLATNGARVVEVVAEPLSEDLITALRAIKDVKSVEEANKMVLVRSDQDVRQQIVQTVMKAKAHLLHLRLQTVGLEQIYFRYFREERD
jgi:ABC-2 type transport system ATP-binding protein